MDERRRELYRRIKKSKNAMLIRSFILVLFLFGVNIFAWFTYNSRAELGVTGDVSSWDVEFLSDNQEVQDVNIAIVDMRPGMLPFNKVITIHNNGEINATLEFEILDLYILGNSIDVTNQEQVINDLSNFYPFKIDVGTTTSDLTIGKRGEFKVDATWEYEDLTKYYQLNSLYEFDASVNYYRKSGDTYIVDNTITLDNFEANRNNLYLEKDDADNYFGESCGIYEKENNKKCVEMKVKLIVTQKENG